MLCDTKGLSLTANINIATILQIMSVKPLPPLNCHLLMSTYSSSQYACYRLCVQQADLQYFKYTYANSLSLSLNLMRV